MNNLKKYFLLSLFWVHFSPSIFAQKNKIKNNIPILATLLDASSQTTYPGVPSAEIVTQYEFSIIWKSKLTPLAIYWQDGDKWMITKTYYVTRTGLTADEPPLQNEIATDKMRIGDTIQIIPIKGVRYKMPSAMKYSKNKKALFLQMGKDNWRNINITKINKRPDLLMP